MIVVDTSVLFEAYRNARSPEKAEVERLVRIGEAATLGIVFAEVLRGARSEVEFAELTEELQAMAFVDADVDTWTLAGRLLFDLARKGSMIPFADAVIAAQALEGGHSVYTHDEHFQRVPGLRLHEANA